MKTHNLLTQLKRATWIKVVCFITLLTAFAETAEATHFRYGSMSYQTNGRTVTFRIQQAWRRTFFGGPPNVGSIVNVGTMTFGDGGSATVNLTVTSVNLTEDWFFGEALITRTYTGTATTFTAIFNGCCRISTLRNNADQTYNTQTTVVLGTNNNAPVSTMPPILNLPVGNVAATFPVPASDPDGNTVTYRLSTIAEMGGSGLSQPVGLSINSVTGLLSFNTVGKTVGHLYSTQLMISDGSALVPLDFIIKIVNQSTPPFFEYPPTPLSGSVIDVPPGTPVSFTVRARDNDSGDQVNLSAVGLPAAAVLSPLLPANGNPVSTTFSWTPGINDLGSRVINFIAQDLNGVQTSSSVTILVSTNPVFDLALSPPPGSSICVETGVTYSSPITAYAPDPLMKLRILSVTGPLGAVFNPALPTTLANLAQTQFSWTPTPADWGLQNFTVTAQDTLNKTSSLTFGFMVNTTPVITSTEPSGHLIVGQPYSYTMTVADPDIAYGDSIEFHAASLPSWLTLVQTGPTTALISGTPTLADVGEADAHVHVEDVFHHCGNHTESEMHFQVDACIPMHLTASATDATCPAASNGSAVVNTNGGTAPFSYVWNTGATAADVSNLAAGTYHVTVTDAFGCSESIEVSVSDLDLIVPNSVAQALSIVLDMNGAVSVSATDIGSGSSDNCGIASMSVSPNTFNCANMGSNTVVLTVTDNSGNQSTATTTVTVMDQTPPQAICKPATLVLANGVASLSVSDINDGSWDACGIASISLSNETFTCNNIGANTVVMTVTDVNGNVSSCTSVVTVVGAVPICSITATPSNATYTGGIANRLYLGYGPQSMNLSVSATGGSSFTYSWSGTGLSSTSGSSNVFTPTAAGTYTLSVTATNANGCISTCSVSICVIDARSGTGNNAKVLLCHLPPGNTANAQLLSISANAVPAHLSNHTGDALGSCSASCGFSKTETSAAGELLVDETGLLETELIVYPNPTRDVFVFKLESDSKEPAILIVYDMKGQIVLQSSSMDPSAEMRIGANFDAGIYLVQIQQGAFIKQVKLTKLN